jgi:TetR/AcrR family transcriptional regulator, acrAB operon repressor
MRRTKEEAEVTRQCLLDAALTVFSQQGYAATRLEDIAEVAEVTRGAIYHHFGGKLELYNALVQERFARVNQMIADILAEDGTPLQILRRLMVRSLEYLEEDEDYRAVQELVSFKTALLPELEAGIRKKNEGTNAFIQELARLVGQGIAAGEIRASVNPYEAALAIIGLTNGLSLVWLLDPQRFSLRERAEGVVDTFLQGLAD